MIGFRIILLAALALGAAGVAAQTDDMAVATTEAPATCVERMRSLVDEVTRLRDAITNDVRRLECVNGHLAKLKALLELSQASLKTVEKNIDSEDEQIELEKMKIAVAASRAEKIATDAAACSATPDSSRPKKRKAETNLVTAPPPVTTLPLPPVVPVPSKRAGHMRTEENCVSQGDAAGLVALAAEVLTDVRDNKVACAEMSRAGIEPPGGWQPQRCLTLDDFCVVVAKLLKLSSASPNDPAACRQALRTAGLPVDALLPSAIEGRDLPLREAEVRAFLQAGYAAPPGH